MLIYGEFNAFAPDEAARIIHQAYAALKPGGNLLLEVSTYESIYRAGHAARSWHTAEQGLFADEPYLCLTESRFELDRAIDDYYVFLAASGALRRYTTMHQGYVEDEYRRLLGAFAHVQAFPALNGSAERGDLFVLVGIK